MPLTLTYRFGTATAPLDSMFPTQLQVDLDKIAAVIGAPGQMPGTTTNDNADPGNVGEYISSTVAAPGVNLTNGIVHDVTSILLTPGDWDVTAQANFSGSPITGVAYQGISISEVSGTFDGNVGNLFYIPCYNLTVFTVTGLSCVSLVAVRKSLSVATTIFLCVQSTFTNTQNASGTIRARRVR